MSLAGGEDVQGTFPDTIDLNEGTDGSNSSTGSEAAEPPVALDGLGLRDQSGGGRGDALSLVVDGLGNGGFGLLNNSDVLGRSDGPLGANGGDGLNLLIIRDVLGVLLGSLKSLLNNGPLG